MNEHILFVDDDPNILEGYQRKLQHVLRVVTAEGPISGLRAIRERGPFAVVVTDMNMPSMNGIDFLKRVREIAPDTVRMMLTGHTDIKVAMEAVNQGSVFRFLTKPCPSKLMGDSLLAAIAQYRLVTSEKELLEGTLKGTTELLAEILSWLRPDAFGRTVLLRNTAMAIARALSVSSSWEIEMAATLSQLGVLAIPQEILAKLAEGSPLSDDEAKIVASVPSTGYELLERIPRLNLVASIVLYQQKHLDGSGVPADAVSGEEIPLGARILKVATDFHELRESGKSRRDCIAAMKDRAGWYDLTVLQALEGGQAKPPAAPVPKQVVSIPFKDLRVDMTLASAIETREGRKLIQGGTVISTALLIRLNNYATTARIREPIEVELHSDSTSD